MIFLWRHKRRSNHPLGLANARRFSSPLQQVIGIGVVGALYWEEWDIGAEFESPARTVTEADIVMFAGLSGDYNPLHINNEYCNTARFGTRFAHGLLVYAIAAGLLFQLHLYDDTLIVLSGFDSLKFTPPVRAGDTIHAKLRT